jgi:hypothetical protein
MPYDLQFDGHRCDEGVPQSFRIQLDEQEGAATDARYGLQQRDTSIAPHGRQHARGRLQLSATGWVQGGQGRVHDFRLGRRALRVCIGCGSNGRGHWRATGRRRLVQGKLCGGSGGERFVNNSDGTHDN